MENKESKQRIEYLDLLRILAIFCVIIVHVYANSQGPNQLSVGSKDWIIGNLWADSVRWTLDVFILISGAVFLGREVPLKKLYFKYIKRILSAFLLWGAFYALVIDRVETVKEFFRAVILGHPHMWYCLMIIGLYMLTPLINLIVEDERRMKYYLILSVIAISGIPSVLGLLGGIGASWCQYVSELINGVWDDLNMQFLLGYVFFFVMGYYLKNTVFTKKQRIIIYSLGILGALIEGVGTVVWSCLKGEAVSAFMGNYSICSVVSAIAVFEFAKNNFKTNKIINTLSGWVFGVYMVHMAVIELLVRYFDFTRYRFTPILYIPFMAVTILVISMIISGILHYIPFLKKYMV